MQVRYLGKLDIYGLRSFLVCFDQDADRDVRVVRNQLLSRLQEGLEPPGPEEEAARPGRRRPSRRPDCRPEVPQVRPREDVLRCPTAQVIHGFGRGARELTGVKVASLGQTWYRFFLLKNRPFEVKKNNLFSYG